MRLFALCVALVCAACGNKDRDRAAHEGRVGGSISSDEIEPFYLHVPDEALADLRERLARTRWPAQPEDSGWENGADGPIVHRLADYWQHGYDWRATEARLNAFEQFTTTIDGERIYFVHARSARDDATPLILLHGWPSSTGEFTALIEPLTTPGDPHAPAFQVIVPALPGFGLSGPTHSTGWNTDRMARALIVLMERLGYARFGVQGGDWGSFVAQAIARNAPDRVIGLHLNFLPVQPPTPEALDELTPEERYRYSHFQEEEFGYFKLQERKPKTPAIALTDSPAGWLAWIAALFHAATDNDGDFLSTVDRDAFLSEVTLYWLTDTIGSSMRIYHEEFLVQQNAMGTSAPRLETPLAFADFPKEVIAPPLRWLEPGYNVVQYTPMPHGGHFAALEEPDLLIEDIRKFFANRHEARVR